MEDEIDFSKATLEDFKLGSQPEQAPEPVAIEPVAEPVIVEPVINEQKIEPEKPIEAEKAPKDSGYKFKDDFIKQVVDFYEKTGDLTPYLQAKLVDFEKMSDEEILRRNLREQYSDLSDKAFDRLYKQQIVDKFKLDADEYGEDDSELGRELLKSEASKVRNQYMDWQKGFQAPEPVVLEDNSVQLLQQFEQDVRSNEMTQSLLSGKSIAISTPDGEFNFEVPQADSLLDMTVDNSKFFSQFANEQGKLDYKRWYKTAAYSQNPEMFEKSLVNFGKALGRSEVTREIKNPSIAQPEGVPTEGGSDFMSGLLQAFQSRGVHK